MFAIFPPIFSTFQQSFNIVFNKKQVFHKNRLFWGQIRFIGKNMDIVENSSFQHLRHTPKDGRFRNAVKTFLAVYAGKWTDSLNPKKFNCGGHICPKVKTPYGQKRGGGTAAPRRRTERRTERSESAAHAKERRKPALLLLTSRLAIVYNYKRAIYNLICLWRWWG